MKDDSRETSRSGGKNRVPSSLIHVKHFVNLLPDAEAPEHLIEHVLDVHPARNPPDLVRRPPDILGPKLDRVGIARQKRPDRRPRCFQAAPIARSGENWLRPRPDGLGSAPGDLGDETIEPLTRDRRNRQRFSC